MVENCVPNVLMLSGLGVRCGFTVALNLMLHVGGYWSAMRAGGSWFCRIKGGHNTIFNHYMMTLDRPIYF